LLGDVFKLFLKLLVVTFQITFEIFFWLLTVTFPRFIYDFMQSLVPQDCLV